MTKKILALSTWFLFLLCSLQHMQAAPPSDLSRLVLRSAQHASELVPLVQTIHYQDEQLDIQIQASEETSINVYNLLGQLIASRTLMQDSDAQEAIIPMQRFEEGTYFIYVQSAQQLQSYSLNTATSSLVP